MRDRRVLLAAILAVAVIVRLAGIGDRLVDDEGYTWLVASAPDAGTFLDRLTAYENTPPLYYFLASLLPTDDEAWLRLPAVLAAVVSVGVLYLAVRPLLGTRAALLAAFGLAVAPFFVSYSNLARGFMLANAGLVIALWAAARLATGGSPRWWWVYGAGATLALYSEYDSAFFLGSLVLALAVLLPGRGREVALAGCAPLLTLLPWLEQLSRTVEKVDETKIAPVNDPVGLGTLRDLTVPLLFGEHGAASSAVLRTVQFLLVAGAIGCAIWLVKRAGKRPALVLIVITGFGTLWTHGIVGSFGPDLFSQHYLTSLVPLVAALLAGAVAWAPWRPAVPATAALLGMLAVAVFVQRHDRELEPDYAPVRALVESSGPRVVLSNSPRALFYLPDSDVRLDRPLGIGAGLESGCGPECDTPLAIVDDALAAGAIRQGPGEVTNFGTISVRLRPKVSATEPVQSEMDPLTCSLALLVSSALGGGPDARAMPVTFQDDALMLHGTPAQVQASARRIASLGADRVRLTAGWSALAPRPSSRRMPHFNARNSDAYPREPWLKLDRAVKAATTAGLDVQIDVAFFAPRWAVSRGMDPANRNRQRWEPNAGRFGPFAEAVAERYSGRHTDPAQPRAKLPVVRLWTTWNEPNHPGFLLPQWTKSNGQWAPRSPHVYRRLHERGYAAIKRVSSQNQVLLGGLSSEGMDTPGPRNGIPPLEFMRELACLDRRGRRLRRPECIGFKPLQADGFSHHPYSLYNSPDVESADPDEATMGDLKRLSQMLDYLHQRGRITTKLPIYLTEYGYETNPPDATRGVSLTDQARYLSHATFIAWQQPDVSMFAQFLMNDIAPPAGARPGSADAARNWQSGLYFHDGRAKPAVQAFKLPFWAEARSIAGQEVVLLFGQVRPDDGRKRVAIEIQGPDGIWRPVDSLETRPAGDGPCGKQTDDFLTDSEGFYLRAAGYSGPATYRMRWIRNSGKADYGVPITVGLPG